MKKKIFILCMIFLLLIFAFCGYKFFRTGNNKNIESIGELGEHILNISNYEIEANVTIYSNKNSNTYRFTEYKMNEYQKQEIFNEEDNNSIVIENDGDKLTIKNTLLDLTQVFENYEEVTKNTIGFDAFLDDYNNSDSVNISEDEKYYLIFVKVKNSSNKYIQNKTLFMDKKSGKAEKIEVKDINNNSTIVIEYTRFQIL